MSNTNTGGPAFPHHVVCENGWSETQKLQGMTLRDYFAVHASEEDIQRHITGLESMIVGQDAQGPVYRTEQVFRSRERARYKWADEMLKARAQ